MDCDFKTMYNCPLCKSKEVEVSSILALFNDVRVDSVSCSKCGAAWKLYQKILDAHVEVTQYPDICVPVSNNDHKCGSHTCKCNEKSKNSAIEGELALDCKCTSSKDCTTHC